jgi:hypothetical protein
VAQGERKDLMIKKIVIALIICSGVSILTDAGAILYAQKIDRSDISVFGRNRGRQLNCVKAVR